MSIIHLYFLFYSPPSTPLTPEAGKALRAIPLWDRVPTTWVNCLSFSIKKKNKKKPPLLSAILPWRQKPATSLLGRLEDCHLPQSRLESLPDYVGPRSVLLFSQLKLDHTFLLAEDWRETLHFSTLKSAISNLHPVNDSSERALAMATSFNGRITRDEESYQDMMLVVAAHRKKYGFKTKEDLKNFVRILFDRR